ncbi:MAG: putative ATP-dependent DNA helicase YoaA [Chlamydiales bacterium]|nr:putative ATP-dependent DNA helicase YoaA [Chlamydiales bacterium]MCH9635095.1 putative ATP-dependent DNA helicase YoaA [Chlamydiales bacterium]MCH9704037.1 DEAD/DEAH box helicase family protein [Chlamydiota bacterium]
MSELDQVAEHLPNFEVREGQEAMLNSCKEAYETDTTLLVEAGTGIGKSLAYLIAALTWDGEPTVIATHTIALQEQLLNKDIPLLLKALDIKVDVALLKGMSNYLCLRKLHDLEERPNALMAWANKTKEGSRSEYRFNLDVAADSESCTNQRCPHFKECFFFKARKRAQDAKIVIANHHLLFADLNIRQQTDNYDQPCILPPFNRLIIDEAHHTEEVATEYFAKKSNSAAILRLLIRAMARIHRLELPNELTLMGEKRDLAEMTEELFMRLERLAGKEERRRIRDLKDLEKWQPLCEELTKRARAFLASLMAIESKEKESVIADLQGICLQLEREFAVIHSFMLTDLDPQFVRWIEKQQVVEARLEVAPLLKEALFDKLSTVILCSATLSAAGNFGFVKNRLGIEEAKESLHESPFDFEKQALLASPIDLPDPREATYTERVSQLIHDTLLISEGGAFVLFTSYQMLRECKAAYDLPYPLFCQGDEPRTVLLDQFRKSEGAVLFGTDSFWEGVDVVGDQLRQVVLVKLPFRVPTDPLFQARAELVEKRGDSAFFHLALPQAMLKFKQGFGRLIRHREDRGVVVCLDPRLTKKGYGKAFLKSLPAVELFAGDSKALLDRLEMFYSSCSAT